VDDLRTPETEAMWQAYVAANPSVSSRYEVVAFGDSADMADELADLVVNGPKRATAGALRDYELDEEPVPQVGDHVVLIDGGKRPVAIWRTTDVEVKPLDQVTESFAWDEGEGDRSLTYWVDAHQRFFRRSAETNGWTYDDQIMTVFERFTVVWPPEAT
jgi:uncharacterized protein YhfF